MRTNLRWLGRGSSNYVCPLLRRGSPRRARALGHAETHTKRPSPMPGRQLWGVAAVCVAQRRHSMFSGCRPLRQSCNWGQAQPSPAPRARASPWRRANCGQSNQAAEEECWGGGGGGCNRLGGAACGTKPGRPHHFLPGRLLCYGRGSCKLEGGEPLAAMRRWGWPARPPCSACAQALAQHPERSSCGLLSSASQSQARGERAGRGGSRRGGSPRAGLTAREFQVPPSGQPTPAPAQPRKGQRRVGPWERQTRPPPLGLPLVAHYRGGGGEAMLPFTGLASVLSVWPPPRRWARSGGGCTSRSARCRAGS